MAKQSFDLDAVFHALGDPTRRAVISRLAAAPATVSELAEPFDMALPSFMKHIGVLERSRLVTTTKTGRVRECALDRESLISAEIWFREQHLLWRKRYANLDELLTKMEGRDDEA
ncbi:metalloregulator ArsR/SmtB family transcription factor [Novosphingobium sp. BL-8H]|uniref:ArsR/SmtB family transcription factor n=1 Tax=Novosphingobium sp. BL-8H TaxID=3127640 RepID=UPI003757DE44